MSWFSNLATYAEQAFTTVVADVKPLIPLAEEAATVAGTLIPSAAPIINTVEAAANSVVAIAPTAISDAQSAISVIQKAAADATPLFLELEAAFAKLFGQTKAGQAVVLTPVTSAATAPAASVTASK